MTDEYVYNPLDRTTYEAIAYNAVGRASEIATYPALSLTHSSGNSGWSVGAVQWDFGQPGRGHMVAPLLDGYQQWAPPNERFNAQDLVSLSHRLQTRGQVGNALTDAEHSRIGSYLRSDGGREFVAGLNQEQIDRKWQNVGRPLSEIAWLQRLNTQDPAQAAEIVAMTSKLYNQNERKGGELIRHLQDTALTSTETSAWIGSQGIEGLKPAARSAIVSGRDGTLAGIRLMNDLELGDRRLSQAWHQEVHVKGNVGLTQEFNTNPNIQLFDGMMRNPVAGTRIFATVDENVPAHAAVISGINAEARLEMARIEQDRNGVLTVESPNGDRYQMTRAGWDRNGIPMQEIQDYDRRVTPFSPVSPISSTIRQAPTYPRDPDHPDHAMIQGAREQVRSLHADQAMPLANQQLGSTTVSGLADVRRSSLGTDDQQRPRVGLGPMQASEARRESDEARSISPAQAETLDLQLGASGPQVRALQSHLRELGYRDLRGQPLRADGVFDGHTRQAVARFQDDMGLSPTGVADEATQRIAQAHIQEQWRTQTQRQTVQAHDLGGHEAGRDLRQRPKQAEEPATQAPAITQSQSPTVMPFSNPLHRHHHLYAKAQEQTQEAGYDFSEARLTQITEALVKGGFQTQGRPWELQMHGDGKRLCFNDPNTAVGGRAMVDVTLPEPSISAVVGKVDAADERTAALMQEWQQQRAAQTQHGPMLG